MTEPTTLRRALPAGSQAHPLIVVRATTARAGDAPRCATTSSVRTRMPSSTRCSTAAIWVPRRRACPRRCAPGWSTRPPPCTTRLHEAGVPQAGLRDADAQGVRTLHAVHPRDDVRSALALACGCQLQPVPPQRSTAPGSLHMAEKPSIEIKSVQPSRESTSPASPPRPSSPPEA